MNTQEQHTLMYQVLNDTVQFYSEDTNRRSLEINTNMLLGTACKYLCDNGNMCAVGRLLNKDVLKEVHENHEGPFRRLTNSKVYLTHKANKTFFENKELHSLSIGFFQDLQHLHDGNDYWIENGLSEKGSKEINKFKDSISDGTFDN